MTPTLERVKQAAYEAIGPEAEVGNNDGVFAISEWHSDCDPPTYVVSEGKVLGFLRWLGKQRRAHYRAMKAEARRLDRQ